MFADESQVRVTVRGTAGSEARRPRFLQAAFLALVRLFLQALLRFAFAPAARAESLAPAGAEASSRPAHANAAITASGFR
jgi:hypothetical protein